MVQNQDFVVNEPRGSSILNTNEVIIFGGNKNQTFIMDVSGLQNNYFLSQGQKQVKVSLQSESTVMLDSKFCCDSDFTVRTFGNYLYAVDGHYGSLHVYSIKDKQWNYSPLGDLGIDF